MANRSRAEELRRLEPSELVVGQVLRGHVRDAAGRILIPKGQVMSHEHLQHLAERGSQALYVASDWEVKEPAVPHAVQPVAPAELLEALKRKHGIRARETHGRRQRRYPWRCQLRVSIQECSDGVVQRRELMVETCDLSGGGFAFISKHFVHIGTVVYPRFECLPGRPVLKGIVRYCHHLEARCHRVGVEFVPLDPGEKPGGP